VADTARWPVKLVVAPALNLLTPEAAKNLEAYVRGGGHLVLTQRSAMKDEDNSLYPSGSLAACRTAGRARRTMVCARQAVPIDGEWGAGEDRVWAEQLSVSSPETRTLMRYGKSNGCWTVSSGCDSLRRTRQHNLHRCWTGRKSHEGRNQVDDEGSRSQSNHERSAGDVDLAIRSGNGKRVFIFTNYGVSPRTIALPSPMQDVLKAEQSQASRRRSMECPFCGKCAQAMRCGATLPRISLPLDVDLANSASRSLIQLIGSACVDGSMVRAMAKAWL